MSAPLCRCCAKPIAKRTDWKILTTDPESMKYGADRKVLVEALPQTKADAQKLFNERITSVRRKTKINYEEDRDDDLGIDQVTLWDGESYKDDLFCAIQCAARFGRMAALHNAIETKAYAAARRKAAVDTSNEA